METKICCRCGLEKELSYFQKENGKYRNPCKQCKKEYLKEYHSQNKEKAKDNLNKRDKLDWELK